MGGLEMTREETLLILKSLASAYPRHSVTSSEAREQYIKCLLDLKYDTAEVAVDLCLKQLKYFPTIAEFRAFYYSAIKSDCSDQTAYCGTYCKVCQNKGFVIFLKFGYEFVAHCTECQRGNSWKYDGRKLTGRDRSENFIPPIQQYSLWGDVVKNRDVNGRVDLGGEFSKNLCLDGL
jgi:hypothetical protein